MDIYVGNIPYDVNEDTLKDAFAEYGAVDNVKIIKDHDTGRSKGFAFVTMSDSSEARAAIGALDGATIDERPIKVNEARQREPRSGGGRGGYGGGGGGGRGHGGGGGFRKRNY